MLRNLLLSGVFALCFVVPAFAQETLRWKFEPGTEWLATFDQQSDVATTVSSKSTTMTVHSGMEVVWKVASVESSGNAVISQRFRRFRITLEMPKTGPIVYDSASELKPAGDAKVLADAVRPLLEAELKLTLSPRGEITVVELDENAQKAVEEASVSPALKGLLSKEGLTNIFRHALLPLPENEARPGDEWSDTKKLDTPLGKIEQKTSYKLLEPEAKSPDVARIESVSTLTPAAENDASRTSSLKEQEQRGLFLYDVKAGEMRSAEVKQKLVTTSSLKDTPIQVRMTSTLKMTLERQ
jgi:hypothetical protein